MKNLIMAGIIIFFFCISSDSKFETFDRFDDDYIRVATDSPATLSWGFSPSVKEYKLFCRYDHEDTSWFIIDSIYSGDSSYINSSYIIDREVITERLDHSCSRDSLFFITLQAINYDDTYDNMIRYFIDSSVCFGNWVLWKSNIIPLKPYPIRRRWFE